MAQSDESKSKPNELKLKVVVNGQPVELSGNLNAPLRTVINKALEVSGNSGQPVENWELRDAGGQVLDPARKLEDFQFATDVTLFLNLKAGVGG